MRLHLLALCLLLAAAPAARPQPPAQPPTPPQKSDPSSLGKKIQDDVERRVGAKLHDNDDEDRDVDFTLGSSNPQKTEHPAPPTDPRNLQAASFGDRLDLTRSWLFHSGPSPDAASPSFHDSDWQPIDTSQSLIMQGFFNLNEVWYRVHIHLPAGSHDLAFTVANFGGSYRVFAGGQEIGGHGRMSGRGDLIQVSSATFPIPDNLLTTSSTGPDASGPVLVLAIHAFVGTIDRTTFTLQDGIFSHSSAFLGPYAVLERDQRAFFSDLLSQAEGILTLWVVLLLLAIALAILIPRVPAYPLLAVYAGGHLLSTLLFSYSNFHYLAQTQWFVWGPIDLADIASELAALEFCRIVANVPRKRWFTAIEVLYLLAYLSVVPAALGILSYAIYGAITRTLYFLLLVVIFSLIALGVRRRSRDAFVLGAFTVAYLLYLALWKGLHYIDFFYPWLTALAQGFMLHLQPGPIGDLTIIAAFLTVVVVRTLRLVRERASIANEIEAARTMQQLLLARSAEPIPGFLVETAYLPAGEVGGDFFLVSPCMPEDGEPSLTAIVGDVSGKGLRAAMRVSLILGVLRREPSREPSAMLLALNEALHADGELGFTTACCVRLFPDGRFSAANAGHIAPYLAGFGSSQEIATPPALPLGLAPDQTYDLVEGRLSPGQRLVLMSDGVPEARSHKGELYGFDRLLPLTLKPAATIAQTAQNFGQDDDITVLTLATTAVSTNRPPPPPLPLPPPRFNATSVQPPRATPAIAKLPIVNQPAPHQSAAAEAVVMPAQTPGIAAPPPPPPLPPAAYADAPSAPVPPPPPAPVSDPS